MFGMDAFGSRLRCDRCGTGSTTRGIEHVPPHLRPFVRGEVVVSVRPIGVCGMCYAVLCADCSRNGRCSACDSPFPLLADCPSAGPPWYQIRKWLKWKRVQRQQYGP